jgi:hypothetical protein
MTAKVHRVTLHNTACKPPSRSSGGFRELAENGDAIRLVPLEGMIHHIAAKDGFGSPRRDRYSCMIDAVTRVNRKRIPSSTSLPSTITLCSRPAASIGAMLSLKTPGNGSEREYPNRLPLLSPRCRPHRPCSELPHIATQYLSRSSWRSERWAPIDHHPTSCSSPHDRSEGG